MFELGNSLREARERQGLDFADLETDTKIRAKYLRAFEEESFEVLPAESYARGFLEVYASRLGLDSQLYVDEFDSRFARGDHADNAVRRIRTARRLRLEASAVLLGLAGIAAVTLLVVAAWQFSDGRGSEPDTPALPEAPQIATPSPSPTPAPAPLPGVTEDPPVPVQPEGRDAELRVEALSGRPRVTIRRNGPTGRVVFSGRLKRGEVQTFTGPKLHAAFPSPRAVNVTVGGATVTPVPTRLIATADGWLVN